MTTREEQRDVERDVLSTLAEWRETIRTWSGSAFVSGEDIGDTAAAQVEQLYLDLCRIGNETVWMEDQITRLRASQAGGAPADVIVAAYKRGWHWNNENEGDDTFLNKAANDYADKVLSAAAPAAIGAGGVPAGWALVPIEPTFDMIRTGAYDTSGLTRLGAKSVYEAMLSASPPPPATDGDALREALEPFALWATLMDKDAPDDAHLPATVPHLSLTLGQARAAADALGLVHASDDPRFNGERDIVLDAIASSPPLAATESEGLVQANVRGNGSVIGPGCQWQPIETAPMDGTGFYYYQRIDDSRFITGAGHFDGYDFRAIDFFSKGDEPVISPTHWTPLPPRPDDRTNASEAQSGSLNQTLPASSVSATDAVEAERAEYERGKQHGADDLRMSQQQCRHLQRELDAAKREIAQLKMARARGTDEVENG